LIALNVLGYHYDIVWAPHTLIPDRFGHSDLENQEIVLRSDLRGLVALDTLFHEYIHAASAITGVEVSETQTHMLGFAMATMFKNNPELIAFTLERIQEEYARNYQQHSRTAAKNRKAK
jgi:hypothetical protein